MQAVNAVVREVHGIRGFSEALLQKVRNAVIIFDNQYTHAVGTFRPESHGRPTVIRRRECSPLPIALQFSTGDRGEPAVGRSDRWNPGVSMTELSFFRNGIATFDVYARSGVIQEAGAVADINMRQEL